MVAIGLWRRFDDEHRRAEMADLTRGRNVCSSRGVEVCDVIVCSTGADVRIFACTGLPRNSSRKYTLGNGEARSQQLLSMSAILWLKRC